MTRVFTVVGRCGSATNAPQIGGGILAHHARERRYAAKRHDIAGHIARTAEQIAFLFDPDDRDGRFRRNAGSIAEPVSIQHRIPDNKNRGVANGLHGGFENVHFKDPIECSPNFTAIILR